MCVFGVWERKRGISYLTCRQRVTPHIKTLMRAANEKIGWLYTGSHNLSQAAWGSMIEKGPSLMIRHFECGVLFLPSLLSSPSSSSSSPSPSSSSSSFPAQFTMGCCPNPSSLPSSSSSLSLTFPVSFSVPPPRFSSDSEGPWVWDRRYAKADDFGLSWNS